MSTGVTGGVAPREAHQDDDHDHEAPEGWVPATETVTLTSVGIDIGSATSHVIFSRLVMERQGHALSSRYEVVERTVLARSPVWLTPYSDERTIDAAEISRLVHQAYSEAGLRPDSVDTGAVIVTGEAARKSNADRIAAALASAAGDFVCATAGAVLEGVLVSHGSGALAASRTRGPVLNVDIGGGTTKLVMVDAGRVDHVHALNVGGRLIAWDDDRVVLRLEHAGAVLARRAGVEVVVGARFSEQDALAVAQVAADAVVGAMAGSPSRAAADQELDITDPLPPHGCRTAMFSGGVGRLVVERDAGSYGDLGDLIAAELVQRLADGPWQVVPPQETLRATVVGVGQFAVQLSGNTISVSSLDALPLRNVQVVSLPAQDTWDASTIRGGVLNGLRRLDREDGDGAIALSLTLPPPTSPRDIAGMAEALAGALPRTIAAGHPVVVVVDQDVAGLLGHLIRGEVEFPGPLVVLDQVTVRELDFLDVGTVQEPSGVVPVVVKSLIF